MSSPDVTMRLVLSYPDERVTALFIFSKPSAFRESGKQVMTEPRYVDAVSGNVSYLSQVYHGCKLAF